MINQVHMIATVMMDRLAFGASSESGRIDSCKAGRMH